MGNSTPGKIVTPKNFNLKLCTRDIVGDTTHQANFGFYRHSKGLSPNRRILPLCDFFDCPVLSFFLENVPRSNAEPIFTLYSSNDVFPRKEVPFGD